jgi:hypothetical protein
VLCWKSEAKKKPRDNDIGIERYRQKIAKEKKIKICFTFLSESKANV